MNNHKDGDHAPDLISSTDIFKLTYSRAFDRSNNDIKWIAKFYFDEFLLDEICVKVTRQLINKMKFDPCEIGGYYDGAKIGTYTRKIVSLINITPLVPQEKKEWKFPHFNNIELYLYELCGNESSIKLWNFTNINKKDVVSNNNCRFRRAVVIDYDKVNVEYCADFKGQPSDLIMLPRRNHVVIE